MTVPHDTTSSDGEPAAAAGRRVEEKIFALLALRKPGATICPSEVARALVGEDGPWREHMPQVRQVAQVLAGDGRLRVTRSGVEVDAGSPGGPIRLGRPADPPA
jgi:hypothetical protein